MFITFVAASSEAAARKMKTSPPSHFGILNFVVLTGRISKREKKNDFEAIFDQTTILYMTLPKQLCKM